MFSPESLQVQSYLFANKTAQGASESLAEQSAWFDMMVENYAGHPIPLSEGTYSTVSARWCLYLRIAQVTSGFGRAAQSCDRCELTNPTYDRLTRDNTMLFLVDHE